MLAAVNKTNHQLEKVEVLLPSEDRVYFLQLHLLQFGTVPIGEKFIYVATLCSNNFRPNTVTIEKFIYVATLCSNNFRPTTGNFYGH
jgi:hypothetical protein